MPSRRQELVVRSGRFVKPTANQVIISTKTKAIYRIFNTGSKPFKAVITKGLNTREAPVYPRCSVDVWLGTESIVKLAGGDFPLQAGGNESSTLDDIKGVFDSIDAGIPVRSGQLKRALRFTNGLSVVDAGPGTDQMYRVFNAGDDDITLTVGGVVVPVLVPGCSRDVWIEAGKALTADNASTRSFLGVYDAVQTGLNVRNGRFDTKIVTAATEFRLIDAAGMNKYQRYRLSNTGEKTFKVLVAGAEIGELARNQSIDVELGDGVLTIGVKALADNDVISGVYVCLSAL